MPKAYNVLIIEDYQLIIDAYKRAFFEVSNKEEDIDFIIDSASNCDEAQAKIEETKQHVSLDLVFLDIKLPPSKDGTHCSGEDLGVTIRKTFPETKIIIATNYCDTYKVNSIFKQVNPEGFLVKHDLSPEGLIIAIKEVLSGSLYYSKSIIELIR